MTRKLADLSRMILWLLAGLALYAAARMIGNDDPVTQVICQKLGNVTTFSWVGYRVACASLGRLTRTSHPGELQARAIVMGAAIIAGALGM